MQVQSRHHPQVRPILQKRWAFVVLPCWGANDQFYQFWFPNWKQKDEHLLFFGVEEPATDFTNFDFLIENIPRIKLMGGNASCLKHMSNYKDDEAQSGVIVEYTKWVVTILLLQYTQLFMKFYKCSALKTCLLHDFSLLNEVCIGCSYVFLVYHWSLAISHRYQGKWFMPKLSWWHEGWSGHSNRKTGHFWCTFDLCNQTSIHCQVSNFPNWIVITIIVQHNSSPRDPPFIPLWVCKSYTLITFLKLGNQNNVYIVRPN